MSKIVRCDKFDYEALAGIWERSVRATHDFLDEDAVREIKDALIPDYFPNVDLYAVTDNDSFVGFIGLSAGKIEMLFVDDRRRGMGYGSELIDFAIQNGATAVDVNEQNPQALKFYTAKGFRITGRDETDDSGRPYPILHLALLQTECNKPQTST